MDNSEQAASRFGDILAERMRELRSERHRDFKLSTHLAAPAPASEDLPSGSSASRSSASLSTASLTFLDEYDSGDSGNAGNASSRPAAATAASSSSEISLMRAIQRAGLCSRRAAMDLVSQGKVKLDGVVMRDPFQRVQAHNDIFVEGHRGRLRFAPPRLWAFHKPAFVSICGTNSQEQRPMWRRYSQMLGFDHLIPVGSLPTRSHGLLMLTNDGELARWLEHPSTRVQSTYVYRVRPAIDHALAMRLNTHGVAVDGVQHREFEFHPFTGGRSRHAIRIKVQAPESANVTAPMPVMQMLQALERRIVRGGRVSFGPFTLRGLGPGSIKEVSVPPFYMKHINPAWMPFVERDWSYFRRMRVQRLMRLARWRHLNDRETEEIEAFSCDELRQVFASGASGGGGGAGRSSQVAVEEEAKLFAESLVETPNVKHIKFVPDAEEQVPWQI